MRALHHRERHRTEHIGWLRAAVLGANDGIVSTASLIMGVAAQMIHWPENHAMVGGQTKAMTAVPMSQKG